MPVGTGIDSPNQHFVSPLTSLIPEVGQEGSTTSGSAVPGPDDPMHHLAVALGLLAGDRYEQPPVPQPQSTGGKNDQPVVDLAGAGASAADLNARTAMAGQQQQQSQMVQQPQATAGAGGDQLLQAARKYLGIPYVYGGTNPATGLDCSGFVQRAFADIGITLPRVTYDQVKVGTPVGNSADLQPGDLVFFVGDKAHVANGHVGIYVGGGMMIDAPHTGAQVRYDQINYSNVTSMRRVIP